MTKEHIGKAFGQCNGAGMPEEHIGKAFRTMQRCRSDGNINRKGFAALILR
jgi:hypothetical protein